jgi:hypothetical protein
MKGFENCLPISRLIVLDDAAFVVEILEKEKTRIIMALSTIPTSTIPRAP